MTTFRAAVRIRPTRRHKSFVALEKKIESNAHLACYNFARNVTKNARMLVPVRTGYLKSQINWKKIKPGEYSIGVTGDTQTRTGAYYGVYVEYGTRHMAAQPYFRPAIELSKKKFREEMRAVFT